MISRIVVGPLETNCYILEKNDKCLIVDPGDEFEKIYNHIKGKKVLGILLTHKHFDHIGALQSLVELYSVPVFNNGNLKEKDYDIDAFNFNVIFTPGHTSDSVTYYFQNDKFMLTGDFIFKDTIGRTDLPTGNFKEMLDSLEKMKKYDDSIVVYPGHGDKTILGEELKIKWQN